MTCEEVKAKLPLYVNGDMADRGAIQGHLAVCPDCRADESELRQVCILLGVPAPLTPPADVTAIYGAALDRQTRSARRWKLTAGAGTLVAAGLLLTAVLPRLEFRADS